MSMLFVKGRIMSTSKYSKTLQFVVLFFLLCGLVIPFIGYRFGVNPNLLEIAYRIMHRMSDLSYPILVLPFIILAVTLLFHILKESKKQEITESLFFSHLIGIFACFIPCCWLEAQFTLGRGAPQGPIIFLFPLLAPVVFYLMYKSAYFFALKMLYTSAESKKNVAGETLKKTKTLEEMFHKSHEVKKLGKKD